jgi:uncharacterized protein YxeA
MWICTRCKKSLDDGYKFCWKCGIPKPAPPLLDGAIPNGQRDHIHRFYTLEHLTAEQHGRTKKILILITIFAIMLVAREVGMFNWYYYTFNTSHKAFVQISGSGLKYTNDGERGTYTTSNKKSNYTGTSEDKAGGVAFNTSDRADLVAIFKDRLQGELKNQGRVSFYVNSVELDGMYILPFYKSGHCKYQLHVQAVEFDSIIYSGNLAGETDFNITGLCSVRTLKEILAKKIAVQATEAVNGAFK